MPARGHWIRNSDVPEHSCAGQQKGQRGSWSLFRRLEFLVQRAGASPSPAPLTQRRLGGLPISKRVPLLAARTEQVSREQQPWHLDTSGRFELGVATAREFKGVIQSRAVGNST